MSVTTIRVLFEASNNVSSVLNRITGDTQVLKSSANAASKAIDQLVAPIKSSYNLSPLLDQFEELEDRAIETARIMSAPMRGVKESVAELQDEFSGFLVNSAAGMAGLSSPAIAFSTTLNKISKGLPAKAFEKFYRGIEKESKRALENAASISDIFRGVGEAAFPSIGGFLGFGRRASREENIAASLREPFIDKIKSLADIPGINKLIFGKGLEAFSQISFGKLQTSPKVPNIVNAMGGVLGAMEFKNLSAIPKDLGAVGIEVGSQFAYNLLEPRVLGMVKGYFNIIEVTLGKAMEKAAESAVRSGFSASRERRHALRLVEKYLTQGKVQQFIETQTDNIAQRMLNRAGFRVAVPKLFDSLLRFLPGLVPNLALIGSLDAAVPGLGTAFSTYGDDIIFNLARKIPGAEAVANTLANAFTGTKFKDMGPLFGNMYRGMDKMRGDSGKGKVFGAIADFGLMSEEWTMGEAVGRLLDATAGRNIANSIVQNALENILGEIAIGVSEIFLPAPVRRIISALMEKMPDSFQNVTNAMTKDMQHFLGLLAKLTRRQRTTSGNIERRIEVLRKRFNEIDEGYLVKENERLGKSILNYKLGLIPKQEDYDFYTEQLTQKTVQAGLKSRNVFATTLEKKFKGVEKPTQDLADKYQQTLNKFDDTFKEKIVGYASEAINAVKEIREQGGGQKEIRERLDLISGKFAEEMMHILLPKQLRLPSVIKSIQHTGRRSLQYAIENIPENISRPSRGIRETKQYEKESKELREVQKNLATVRGETLLEQRRRVRLEISRLKQDREAAKRGVTPALDVALNNLKRRSMLLDEKYLREEIIRLRKNRLLTEVERAKFRFQYKNYQKELTQSIPSTGLAIQQRFLNSLTAEFNRTSSDMPGLKENLGYFQSNFENIYKNRIVNYATRAIDAAKNIRERGGSQSEIDEEIGILSSKFVEEFKGLIPKELRDAPGLKALEDMAKLSLGYATQKIQRNLNKQKSEGDFRQSISSDSDQIKKMESQLQKLRGTDPVKLIEKRTFIQEEILRLSVARNEAIRKRVTEIDKDLKSREKRLKNLDLNREKQRVEEQISKLLNQRATLIAQGVMPPGGRPIPPRMIPPFLPPGYTATSLVGPPRFPLPPRPPQRPSIPIPMAPPVLPPGYTATSLVGPPRFPLPPRYRPNAITRVDNQLANLRQQQRIYNQFDYVYEKETKERRERIKSEQRAIRQDIIKLKAEKIRIERAEKDFRQARYDLLGRQTLRIDEKAILEAQLKRSTLPDAERTEILQRLGKKTFSQREQIDLVRKMGSGFESQEVIEAIVSRMQGISLTEKRKQAYTSFAESGGTISGPIAALLKRFKGETQLTQEEIFEVNERINQQIKRSKGIYSSALDDLLSTAEKVVSAFPKLFKESDIINRFKKWNEETNGVLGTVVAQTGQIMAYSLAKGVFGGLSEGFYPVIESFDRQILRMKQGLEDLPLKYSEPAKAIGNFSLSLVQSTSALGEFIKIGNQVGKIAINLVNASQSLFFLQQGFDILFATLLNNPIANFVRMSSELEQQIIRIKASVLSTNRVFEGLPTQPGQLTGVEGLAALQKPTENAIEELRKRSLELATFTSADLIGPFGVVAGMMGGIGASMEEAVDLTISFASALSTLGIPAEQAAQEVRSILLGDITNDSLVARTLQISNTQVQSWRLQNTLVEKLQQKLSPLVAGQKEASKMLNGIISNTREFFQEVGRKAAIPIFESLKSELEAILNYLTLNQKAIQDFANEAFLSINQVFKQTNEKGEVVGGIVKPLRELFGVFEGGAGNVVRFALESIVDIINIFSNSVSRTIGLLKPFIDLFTGLTGSLMSLGGPLIAMAIQFKTLQFGISALSGGAGLMMRVLPGIGPLMQFLAFRTLPLINTFAFLTKNLGFNAAAFLTVGQNMRAIPGMAGQINQFLGMMGPLAPVLTGIVPLLSTILIKSSGLASVLRNLGGGLILGNLVKTLPNVVRGLGALAGNRLFKGMGGVGADIRKEVDTVTDSLAKYIESMLSAEATSKAFAATTNTVFANFRGWLLRTTALTAAIYGLVTAFNKLILKNQFVMDVIRGTATGFIEMAKATKEFLTTGISGTIIKIGAGFGAILFTMARLVVLGKYLQHVFIQAAGIIATKFSGAMVGLLRFADFIQGIPLIGKSMADQARATAFAAENFNKAFKTFSLQKEAQAAKDALIAIQSEGLDPNHPKLKEAKERAIATAKASGKAYQDLLSTGISERTLGDAIGARLKGIQQSFQKAISFPISQIKNLGTAISNLPSPTAVWGAATQRASVSVKAMGMAATSGVAGIKGLIGQIAKAPTPTAAWGIVAQRTAATIKAMGMAAQSAAAKMNIPFPIGQTKQMGQSAQQGATQVNALSGAAMRNGVAMKAMAKNILGAVKNLTLMMASMAALIGLISAASFAWYSWITMPKDMAELDEIQESYAVTVRSFDTLKGAIEWLREDSPKAVRGVANAVGGLFDLITGKKKEVEKPVVIPSPSEQDYKLYDKLYKARERTEERTRNGIALTSEEYAENARLVGYFQERIRQKEDKLEKVRAVAARNSNKDVRARAEATALDLEVEIERFKKAIEGVATTQIELPMLGEYLDQVRIKAGLAWQAIQNPSGDPEIYKKQLDNVVALNQKLYELGDIDASSAIAKLAKVTETEVQDTEGQVEAAYKAIFAIIDSEAAKVENRLKTARQRIETKSATGKLSEIDKEKELLKLQGEEFKNREKALQQKIRHAQEIDDTESVRKFREEITQLRLQAEQVQAEGSFKLFELDIKRIKDQTDRAIDIIKSAQTRGLIDNQQAIKRYTDEAVEGLRDRITRIQEELNSANYLGRSQREGMKRDMAVLNADIREAQNQAFEARLSDFEQDSQELISVEETRMRNGEISELEFTKRRQQILMQGFSKQQQTASEHSRIIGSRDREGQEAINAKRAELQRQRLDAIRETFEKELDLIREGNEQYLTGLEERFQQGKILEKRYIQQRLYAQMVGIQEEQRVLREQMKNSASKEDRKRINAELHKLNIQRIEIQDQYRDDQLNLIKKGEDQQISILQGQFAQNLSSERSFLESKISQQRQSIQESIALSRKYEQIFTEDPNRLAEARAQTAGFLSDRLNIEKEYYEERSRLIEDYSSIESGLLKGKILGAKILAESEYKIEKKRLSDLLNLRREQSRTALNNTERQKAIAEQGKLMKEIRDLESQHNSKLLEIINNRAANQITQEEARNKSISGLNDKRLEIELNAIEQSLRQLNEYQSKVSSRDKETLEQINTQRSELLSKRRQIEKEHYEQSIEIINASASEEIKREEAKNGSIADLNKKRLEIELNAIEESFAELEEYQAKVAEGDEAGQQFINNQRSDLLIKRRDLEREYYKQIGEMLRESIENEKTTLELRVTQGVMNEREYLKAVREINERGIGQQIENMKQQLNLRSEAEIEERSRLNAEIAKLEKEKIDLIVQALEQEVAFVERQSEKATDIIATAQAEQELAIYKGQVAREAIANRRLDMTQDRIKAELKAESEKLRVLRSVPPLSDPRAEEQRQTRIRESIRRTAELRLESIKTEEERYQLMIDRQVKAIQNQTTAMVQSFESQNQQLDLITKAFEIQNKLLQAREGLANSLEGLIAAEYKFAEATARTEQERSRIRMESAWATFEALDRQQEMAQRTFEIEKKQAELAQVRAEWEQKIAEAKAVAGVAEAQAELARTRANREASPEEIVAAQLGVEASLTQLAGARASREIVAAQRGAMEEEFGMRQRSLEIDQQAQRRNAQSELLSSASNPLIRQLLSRQMRGEITPQQQQRLNQLMARQGAAISRSSTAIINQAKSQINNLPDVKGISVPDIGSIQNQLRSQFGIPNPQLPGQFSVALTTDENSTFFNNNVVNPLIEAIKNLGSMGDVTINNNVTSTGELSPEMIQRKTLQTVDSILKKTGRNLAI